MKLLFIYGPPAAGKLTIAKAIAAQTNMAVFDNHKTIDFVADLFPDGGAMKGPLIEKLRLDVIEAAAQAGHDLIFTYVYQPGDEPFISAVVAAVQNMMALPAFCKSSRTGPSYYEE